MVENNNILRLGACSKVYVRPGGARAGDSDSVCEVVVCVRGVYARLVYAQKSICIHASTRLCALKLSTYATLRC